MRRILWRQRCAELYRAFLNDPTKSGLAVEESQHLRHERLEERIVLDAPTIDQAPDLEVTPGENNFPVDLTGITDGDGGNTVASVTAQRVNISGEPNILSDINVTYTAGDSTATLTFDTSNNRGADNIRVTVTDDANESVTMTFRVTVPLAVDDTATTTENAAVSGNLLSNDNLLESEFAITNIKINGGADQDPTGSIVSPGTFTLDAENGSFSFDPGTDFDYLADGESATLTVEYEVTEWDDSRRRGSDETGEDTATLTMTITGENDAPNIDLDADDSSGATGNDYQGAYFIGQASPSAVVDSDLEITDPDQNQEFDSATITLTNPSDGVDEGIAINSAVVPVGVSVDISVANQITITSSTVNGTVSQAQLETIIQTLTYENTSLTPTVGQRTITIVISDGTADSAVATSTITVALNSDLAISATMTPASVHAGQEMTYTITATNNGPGDSTQVKITDLIPSGTNYVSATPSAGTFDDTSDEWTIGDLDSMESATITLVVLVPSTTADGASITNQATITSDATVFNDPTASNNTLAETTNITREVDIDISAFTGPASAVAGQEATYSITVTNNGPSEATGVAIDVPTPVGTSVVTASTSGSYDAGQQSFLIGTLDADASVTLTYVILLDADLADGTMFNVVPTVDLVALTETDSDGTNDQESITTTVGTLVDLDVSIVESADPVDAGDSMSYTVTVGNKANFSDATGVEIELDVPPEVTDVSAFSPSVGSVAFDTMSGTWIWTIGNLASDSSETVVITVNVPVSAADNAQLSIDAAVSGVDQSENNTTDDLDSETTEIDAVIDIAIVSVDGPTTAFAGQTVTYTIVVRNDGGLTETDVRIQVNQPTGTGNDSGSATQGTFLDGSNYFNIGTLTPGQEETLTYTVTISSNLNDGDTVTVSPFLRRQNLNGTDVDDTNDQIPTAPSKTTTINTIVDLDVTIVESTDPVLAGNSMTYTVTASNKDGFSDATGVVIELDVPPEVTDVSSFSTSTGTVVLDAMSGKWMWTIGDLAADDSETVTITVAIPSSAANNAQVQMDAAVSAVDQTENDISDDTATETTDIDRDADLSLTVVDSPDPVTAGQNINYTLTVDNLGPSDASNVAVAIPVPTGVTVNGGSFVASVGSVAFDSGSGNWIWTIGSLTETAVAPTLTFIVTVDQTIADGGTITLSPIVSGTETDSTPGNNSPSENTTVANATPTHTDPMFMIDEDTGPPTTTINLLNYVDDDQGDANLTFSNVVIGGVSIDLSQPAGTTYLIPSGNGGALGDATVTIIDSTTISYTVPTLVDGLPSNENLDVALTFDVTDSAGQSHAATISLTIDGQNDPPTAVDDTETTPADTTIEIAVLVNDTDVDVIGASVPSEQLSVQSFGSNFDPMTGLYNSVQSVSGATLSLMMGSGGTLDSIIYDPTGVQAFQDLAPGEEIVDTFSYILVDSSGLTSMATVTVTVTGVNDIPVGVETTFTTDEDNSLPIDWQVPFDPRDNNDSIDRLVEVSGQDMSVDTTPIEIYDGSTLIGTLVYDSANETLTFVPDESLQTLSVGDSVEGTFTMVVEDSFGGQSLPVTFTIRVNGANDNPELGVNPIVGSTDEDNNTTVQVVDFFVDIDTDSTGNLSIAEVDGQPVDTTSSYTVVSAAGGQIIGTVSYNSGDNSLTFAPDLSLQQLPEGSSIEGTVSLRVTDQHGGVSGTADLTVTVTGLNDSPTFTLSNIQFDGTTTQPSGVTATIVEGSQIVLSGSFTDVDQPVGTVDQGSHTLVVMYEIKGIPYEAEVDNFTVTQQLIGGQTVNVFSFTTTLDFPDDPTDVADNLTITLELSDNDAPNTNPVVLTETFTVEVLNENPEIASLPKTTTLNTLGQVNLPLGVRDPGVLDRLNVFVDWGDGAGLVPVERGIVLNEDGTADLQIENQYAPNDVDELNFDILVELRDEDGGVSSQFIVNVTVPAGLGFLNVTPDESPVELSAADPVKPVPIGQSTNFISIPEDVQRALSQPGEVETVELELRIVWNYGEADEWEEKIRQRVAENRTELQEKLKELSELLQGLPDNQYRAYLVRGDGSEILLQEVRIREGKIVDTNQKEETPSSQNTSGAATDQVPDEQTPGEPTSRLDGVLPRDHTEEADATEDTPFAPFGRELRNEAWQSVYRARVASFKNN